MRVRVHPLHRCCFAACGVHRCVACASLPFATYHVHAQPVHVCIVLHMDTLSFDLNRPTRWPLSLSTDAKSSLEALIDRVRTQQQQAAMVDDRGEVQVGELVIDGKTLSYVLGSDLEEWLAEIGAACGSVVICRASPSQKAAIVRMMMQYEMRMAEGALLGCVLGLCMWMGVLLCIGNACCVQYIPESPGLFVFSLKYSES